jgi:putative flippase GtrA
MPKKKTKPLLKQIIEYFITGGVWFWTGYILIVSLDGIVGLFWANFIGNAVGITLNFILSRYWVFSGNKDKDLAGTTWKYIIYTVLNAFILNYLILLGLKRVGIEPEIGQFIAAGFFTVWNYVWYKLWVFKEDDEDYKKPRRKNK